ncbi:MAG TPA: hypothetical protein VMF11_11290 [Candidatus Baltobacteraceae bacterium]|nr:hypothetical protein [Candidatus Baltobacteraceae bacterium]
MRNLASVALVALLAGCGGGGSTPSLPVQSVASPAPQPTQQSPQSVKVSFNIIVPTASGASARRVPNYVSASTKSASIAVGSAMPTTVNCTATCSGTVSAPVGSDTFTVNLYDATNGTGNVLSTGALTQTIVANTANSVNVTFNGVVASLSIVLGASGTAGTPALIPVSVNALDADGNTIVGPGVYVNASDKPLTIALSDSDPSGATALSQTSLTQPTSGITLTYTGLAITSSTIGGSAAGITTSTTSFTPTLQPIVVTTNDTQNPAYAGIDLYATSGTGSSATFSASEVGWTNAPYDKTLTVATGSGCASIATVAPSSGTSFTASVVASPSAGTCTATLSDGAGQSQAASLAYTSFVYTGASQSITLPSGVTNVTITAAGAQGGTACVCSTGGSPGAGGEGGSVTATLAVTAGMLDVLVGGAGGTSSSGSGAAGGYNGGAVGGSATGSVEAEGGGGGGGGASSVTEGSTQLVVAGGGGGGGIGDPGCTDGGGNGGYPDGTAGQTPGDLCATAAGGGGGGTQSAGGGGGQNGGGGGGARGSAGSAGAGGAGGTADSANLVVGGGGGGGGYYGGGGGGGGITEGSAGGGAGSSFYISTATNVTTQSGTQSGNGYVIITW